MDLSGKTHKHLDNYEKVLISLKNTNFGYVSFSNLLIKFFFVFQVVHVTSSMFYSL